MKKRCDCIIPSYEVPLTEAPTATELPALANLCLDMQGLAEAASSDLPAMLQPLITAYATWITEQEQYLIDPGEDLQSYHRTAVIALQHCHNTLERIRAGIMLLAESPDAARAFTFMNRAMWQQRIHTLHTEAQRRNSVQMLADIDIPT